MTWQSVSFFGLTHVLIPSDTFALCNAWSNPNNEVTVIDNIAAHITCDGCLRVARAFKIPTSV